MNQALLTLLQQQRESSAQLLSVLEQESQAVLDGDLEQLEQVSQAKEACCQAISRMEDNWPHAMRGDGARQWLRQQGEVMLHTWDDLISCLSRCRRQNDANGLLIAQRQQWVAEQLSPVSTHTYGAAGQSAQSGTSNWVASV